MPEATASSADRLLLIGLAALACLPGALPGAEGYIDNAPHLAEVVDLARHIWPEDGGWVGWSDRAQAGQAVGQLNAPLPWGVLAGLTALGLPLEPLYRLCAPLSNVAYALGLWRLARAVLPGRTGPLLAAALGACMPQDLYGIAGAAGGMWPFRLAHGILLWGMAELLRRPRLAGGAIWLALTLLCHTFAGVVALTWAVSCGLLHATRRRWRDVGATAGATALALLLTAGFWAPLLDPALRSALAPRSWPVSSALAWLALPADAFALAGGGFSLLGGPAGLVITALMTCGWGLLAARLLRARAGTPGAGGGERPALAGLIGLGLAALVALVVLVIPATGWGGLGPNPWRYLTFARSGLALAAGAGFSTVFGMGAARAAALAAALAAAAAGWQEVPRSGAPEWAAMTEIWAELAAAQPLGRVYVENTAWDPEAVGSLRRGHVGALLAVRHDLPVLGTWFSVTPTPTQDHTASELDLVMSAPRGRLVAAGPEGADWLHGRFQVFGVGAVVTHSPALGALLAADERYALVSRSPPFAAFALRQPPQAMVGAPAQLGALSEVTSARGRVSARVSAVGTEPDAAVPFRVRQSWHPWWRATLDGAPVALTPGEGDGLIRGEAPGSGALVITWEDRGRGARWLSLMGALVLAIASARGALVRRREVG